jgi:excisionase family DNA binding protein
MTETSPKRQHPSALLLEDAPVTLADYLTRRGLPVSEHDLVRAVDELLSDTLVPASVAPLSCADEDFLSAHSGVTPATGEQVAAAMAATTAELVALVETSLSAREVAEATGRDASTVRHWIRDGALHTLQIGGRRRLPRWQFTDDGQPLPGLGQVLAALPDGLHPLSVLGFFTSPKPELEIADVAASPRDWLAGGGDARPVAALAAGRGDIDTAMEHFA